MGQARDVMDRLTEAVNAHAGTQRIAELYAPDAVAFTPDAGEIQGRDNIVRYWQQTADMIPDGSFEMLHSYEIGNTAIEGLYLNTGHGTLGWTMSSGSARIVADIVSGRVPDIDVRDLAVARYS